ncbi:RNA-directed DNA polymerase from mobile element jockey-like [Brachionus plicatilis]|uniref:RNA-directed DNA polymerase from mobile element jockey-like n=1 Tax=Brachionus plicatilis TaxID=10195 RepID=A0A3M7R5K0_BRAPC|nr:RNA-directed DNA polymerase from mobile element jockey-like [Brachionus plicatilis]
MNIKERDLSKELIQLSKAKKELWHKFKASRGKIRSIEQECKKVKREIDVKSREATRYFEKNLVLDTKNPKRLYSYISGKQKVRHLNSMVNSAGEVIVEKQTIANILNAHCTLIKHSTDQMPVFSLLKPTLTTLDSCTWNKLYTCYIRPLIEFAVSFWNPYGSIRDPIVEKQRPRSIDYAIKEADLVVYARVRKLNYAVKIDFFNIHQTKIRDGSIKKSHQYSFEDWKISAKP